MRKLFLLIVLTMLIVGCVTPQPTVTPTLPSVAAQPTNTVAPSPLPPTPTSAPPTLAPTIVPSPTSRPTSVPTQVATSVPIADFVSAKSSVWDFAQSPDVMSGTCTKGAILPPYGLTELAPIPNGLIMTTQEPSPYNMIRVRANVYSYSGPSPVNDGAVTLNLTFSNANTVQMTRAFVPKNDPNCTHSYTYLGKLMWVNP
ncbi:MAG: hypothetical protein AABZ78_10485 [Chloroflexota bacterium]